MKSKITRSGILVWEVVVRRSDLWIPAGLTISPELIRSEYEISIQNGVDRIALSIIIALVIY